MTRRQRFLITVLAVALLGAGSAQAEDVLDLLPDDAPIVIVYDGDQKAMTNTALNAIWNEPGMQEFFAPVWQAARQALGGMAKPHGIDIVALEPLLKSRLAVAVYPPARNARAAALAPPMGAPDIAMAVSSMRFLVVADIGAEGSPERDAVSKAFAKVKGPTQVVGGVSVTRIAESAAYAIKGSSLLFGTGKLVEAALAADMKPLTKSPTYVEMSGQTKMGGAVLGIIVDYRKLLGAAGRVDPDFEKFMKAAGLSDMKALALAWAPKGRGMMTTIFIDTPTGQGFLAALKAPPVDEKMLQLVPKDVQHMCIFNLDTARLYDAVLVMARELAGPDNVDEIDQAIRKAEQATGVKFREELLASLDVGTAVAIQDGGLFLPNITVVQKVRDAKAADEAMGKLLAVASRAANKAVKGLGPGMGPGMGPDFQPQPVPPWPEGGLREAPPVANEPPAGAERGADKPNRVELPPVISSVDFKGVTIKYANVVIVSPAYAIKDGYLYVAASPVELKDFFDSQAKGSIAEKEDWKFVRGQLSLARPQVLGYGEFKEAMKKYYYLLPMVGSLVTALDQVPVKLDVGKLPGAEQFASHLFGMSMAVEVSDTGIRIEQFSPTGSNAPAKWNMQMQMLGSMMPMFYMMQSFGPGMGGPPMGMPPMDMPPMAEPPLAEPPMIQ